MKLIIVNNPFKRDKDSTTEVDLQDNQLSLAELQAEYIPSEVPTCISIDGQVVSPEEWATRYPKETEQIVFVPIVGDDNTIKIIVFIAVLLIINDPNSAAFVSGVGLGSAAVGAAVIMIGTGLLLNALMPPPGPKKIGALETTDSSATWGWNPSTTQDQGISVPMFYGKNKVYGNVIAANIDISADHTSQTLNALFGLGDGPCRNVESSVYGDSDYGIYDIKVNDQPIENFTDIFHDERFGTLAQTVIANFNDTVTERSVSSIVKYDTPITHTTSNPGYSHLLATLAFPAGLYHSNDQGGLDNYTVVILVEVSEASADVWTTIGSESVTDNKNQQIFRTYDSKTAFPNGLDTTKDYDIRVSKLTADNSNSRYAQTLQFLQVEEIVEDDFTYPKTALLSLKALATDQLSGSIRFSCIQEGKIIRVWNGAAWSIAYSNNPAWVMWDILTQPVIEGAGTGASPYAIATEGADPIYRAIDPNLSADQPNLNLAAFYELAQFCDDQVPNGQGTAITNITKANPGVVSSTGHTHENGDTVILTDVEGMTEVNGELYTVANAVAGVSYELSGTNTSGFTAYTGSGVTSAPENRITFNGGFDTETSVWQAALKICEIARCALIWNGMEITIAIDKATTPTQMFTVGNIFQDSFKETFLPQEDRASEIEIQFLDSEQDYERVPFNIFNTSILNPSNKITLQLFGVNKGSEAWRAGMFRLNQNNLLKRTLEFDVDIDAIACTIGDVIYVQHDIVNWGSPNGELGSGSDDEGTGGRLLSATNVTNSIMTVDRNMTFEDPDWDAGGNIYEIMLRTQDDNIETKTITGVEGDNNEIITVSGTFSSTPKQGDVWAIGIQNLVAKPFRITGMSKSQDQRVHINCIEYIAAIYETDNESAVLPAAADVFNTQVYEDLEVTDLVLQETAAVDESGVILRGINVSFGIPTNVLWKQALVYHKAAGVLDWTFDGTTTTTSFLIDKADPETLYSVRVISENNLGTKSIWEDSPTETITTTSNSSFHGTQLQKRVDGLELDNQGNNTDFVGRDAKFVWHRLNAIDENIPANEEPNGAGSSATQTWFKDYEVKIFNSVGNLRRTEYVQENFYVYTYEKNYEDGGDSAIRTFSIEVRARDRFNRISLQAIPIIVTNQAPVKIASYSVFPYTLGFQVRIPVQTDIDLAGYIIYASQTTPVIVTEANVIYRGKDNNFNHEVETGGSWYVKVTAYDDFGEDGLNISDEVATTVPSVASATALLQIPTFDPAIIYFTNNSPGAGSVAWNSGILTYDGADYLINAGTTDKEVIYWDKDNLDSDLQGQDGVAALNDISKWTMAVNDNGIAYPVGGSGGKIIHAGIIEANSIKAAQIAAGTITTNEILARTIIASDIIVGGLTGTEIASDSISTGHLVARSIQASDIAANVITAAEMITTENVITTKAQMGSATISDLHVGSLVIGTTKIKDNAVTNGVSAYTAGDIVFGTSATTVQSVAITTDGSPVFITFNSVVRPQSSSNPPVVSQAFLKRDASTLVNILGLTNGVNNSRLSVPISISDTPPAGTYTYSVTFRSSAYNCIASNSSLFAIETKK